MIADKKQNNKYANSLPIIYACVYNRGMEKLAIKLYEKLANLLTQKGLAKELGVSQAAVSRRICGAKISIQDYEKLVELASKHNLN